MGFDNTMQACRKTPKQVSLTNFAVGVTTTGLLSMHGAMLFAAFQGEQLSANIEFPVNGLVECKLLSCPTNKHTRLSRRHAKSYKILVWRVFPNTAASIAPNRALQ